MQPIFTNAQERDADAIAILVDACCASESDKALGTLLHAIYYLRTGKYPFNRIVQFGDGDRS